MNTEQSSNNALSSLIENVQFLKKVSGFLAAPVSIIFHRRQGYRELSPRWTAVVAIAMCLVAAVFPAFAGPSQACVYEYAVVMLGLCRYQRVRRWDEFVNVMKWHTRSIGKSWLDGLPLPAFFRPWLRTERFLEPLVAIMAGFVVFACLSKFLGMVIIVAGFFHHVYHEEVLKKQIDDLMNDADNVIESEYRSALMTQLGSASYADEAQDIMDGSGMIIPAGLDFSIRQKIMQRRAALESKSE